MDYSVPLGVFRRCRAPVFRMGVLDVFQQNIYVFCGRAGSIDIVLLTRRIAVAALANGSLL